MSFFTHSHLSKLFHPSISLFKLFDFQNHFDILNLSEKRTVTSKHRRVHSTCRLFLKIFSLFRISGNLQTILAGSFFFQMAACAGFLAFMLLSLDQNMKTLTFDVVINFFCTILQIVLNFSSCNHAQTITDRSFEVAEDFYNILWYKLPCEQWKMIKMVIQRAQKPFYLRGYKIFTCSMETFLTVRSKEEFDEILNYLNV